MTCALCMIDNHECSVADRLAAYFVIGMVHDETTMCPGHVKVMITGAAVVAESKGDVYADAAKEIRRIAAHEPLRVVPSPPPSSPSGREADRG